MIAVALATIIVILAALKWYKRKPFLPPGPRGIPFFGVLPFLGKTPPMKLEQWRKKYGNLFTVQMGEIEFLAIADYDLVYEARFVKILLARNEN